MVKIRLRRVGAKGQPSYRLVVADVRAPRDGAFIAILGHYNPLTDPETVVIDEEKGGTADGYRRQAISLSRHYRRVRSKERENQSRHCRQIRNNQGENQDWRHRKT